MSSAVRQLLRTGGLPPPTRASLRWRAWAWLVARWNMISVSWSFEGEHDIVFRAYLSSRMPEFRLSRDHLPAMLARVAALTPGEPGVVTGIAPDGSRCVLSYDAHHLWALRCAMAAALRALQASGRVGLLHPPAEPRKASAEGAP